jgi:signal transduction histidine kinase
MFAHMKNRFLTRLARSSEADRLPVERVLATARVFLTTMALVAVFLDATEPTRYVNVAYTILASYVAWAIGIWAILRRKETLRDLPMVVHVLDIVFPIVFMMFTAGPNSPFFSFFLFVITAAAFRWGLPNTVLTSIVVSGLIGVEAVILSFSPHHWLEGEFEVNRFIIRISYLLTLGVLVGYLGEEEKRWRAENATINRLLANIKSGAGLRAGMEMFLGELLRIFRASRAIVVLTDFETQRAYLWRQERGAGYAENSELQPEVRPEYMLALPTEAFFAKRMGERWKYSGVNANGQRINIEPSYDPEKAMPEMHGAGSVLAASLRLGEEWSGCVLLVGAVTGTQPADELRFVQNLIKQTAPALYSVFLIRRLRSRAGAIERSRVARELHDGAIQAMISVEMQLDVLRRQSQAPDKTEFVAGRLEQVQQIVHQQVFELRMLMQQMKPVDFRPGQILDHMAETVDRFRNDSGIGAQFITTLEDVDMPARTSRELARILQEALVNVRKHSGASMVQVRFGVEDGCWRLGIVDNGRGFQFSGQMSLQELDASRMGPAIVKERVRSLGGDLTLKSQPGNGSELLISLQQKAHRTHV